MNISEGVKKLLEQKGMPGTEHWRMYRASWLPEIYLVLDGMPNKLDAVKPLGLRHEPENTHMRYGDLFEPSIEDYTADDWRVLAGGVVFE